MKLRDLYDIDSDVIVTGISINSKEIEHGNIFVCVSGVNADRHDYVDEAVTNGASAIIASKKVNVNVPVIYVEDTNKELPLVASKLYNYPENNLDIIGITGTNGKTTVASIIQDMIGSDICAYMGTNGIRCSKFNEAIRNTTPDSDRLYKYFRRFVDSGCNILSMETSSEAFYRHRLDNLKFKVAILTNITEDHLNIHKTIDNYVSCKKELFTKVLDNGYSILNKDDKYYNQFIEIAKGTILTYGEKDADLEILSIEERINETLITLKYKEKEYSFASPLLGKFNVYNLCASILTLITFKYDIEDIISRVKNIKVPHGRCELLDFGQDYKIILDYAHTTDAFNNLYNLLNKVKTNRLITITGSAGGREKEKRPSMGKTVLDNSDYVIFTMDDPRYESVLDIINDLTSASDKTNYEIIVDRKEAIYKAFSIAKKDDIILIAGKGTDNYMAIEDKYLPYSDLETIKEYFK